MSYDLFFRAPREIDAEDLAIYFTEQRNFRVTEERAHYENEATGVYFGFDFTEPTPGRVPCAFNMNYFRPHVFGLEAEPIMTAFVAEFDLGVDDPQTDGMGKGPYSPAGFLRGWNAGNRFGYRAILSQQPSAGALALPSARVEAMWRWNFAKDTTAEHFMDLIGDAPPCFVPTIMAVQTGETEVKTLVIWDLEMAIAIPDVDLVMTMTDDGVAQALSTSDVLGSVAVHSTWTPDHDVGDGLVIGTTTRLVDTMPPTTTRKLRAAMRPFKPICRLGPDQVLDAELVSP